jgi:S-adenosylmethionine/arginine decarboxylase-like enzyme
MTSPVEKQYGSELLIDLVECDPTTFTRESIDEFFTHACNVTRMVRVEVHFWDEGRFDPNLADHVAGISAVCFIETSNMTIHALDRLKQVYLNIFTCSDFKPDDVVELAKEWFGATYSTSRFLNRGGLEALQDCDD